ncbi:hypothetical protein F7725_014108 [Dissostichus mawsoni]|uniref:Uncharacterized protein n=1 Tax=Dissostichus mawsoni TaxID=36200 RepID=A0A7J5YVF1_DISMA|nr:hypothetical protein F7725_014108 [Dissostichus mawsoni]
MNILIVFALHCSMATLARSAPLQPEMGTLVEGEQFQEIVLRSRSLIEKILLSIPGTHKECIHIETLKLNSSENAKFVTMASTIGIPPAPVLKVVSENFSLETGLRRMSEGLQLHRALLSSVSPRLEQKDRVIGLQADIRDLVVQVAAHLTLVQLQAFGQDTVRCLRGLDRRNDEETQS